MSDSRRAQASTRWPRVRECASYFTSCFGCRSSFGVLVGVVGILGDTAWIEPIGRVLARDFLDQLRCLDEQLQLRKGGLDGVDSNRLDAAGRVGLDVGERLVGGSTE